MEFLGLGIRNSGLGFEVEGLGMRVSGLGASLASMTRQHGFCPRARAAGVGFRNQGRKIWMLRLKVSGDSVGVQDVEFLVFLSRFGIWGSGVQGFGFRPGSFQFFRLHDPSAQPLWRSGS